MQKVVGLNCLKEKTVLNKNIIFGNCWPRDYFSLSLNVCVLNISKGDFYLKYFFIIKIIIPCIYKKNFLHFLMKC